MNEHSKAAKRKEWIVRPLRQTDSIAARRHIQTIYNSNQQQWNKRSLKGNSNNVTLNAVLNKNTGQMLNDPNKITEYVHEAFQQQARPADGRTKTRKYLPEEAKRDYPWEAGAYSNIDPYTLETKAGQPEAVHMAVNKLFVLTWKTSSTPTAWKELYTALIHKKGDASDLGNWRPIVSVRSGQCANTAIDRVSGIVRVFAFNCLLASWCRIVRAVWWGLGTRAL